MLKLINSPSFRAYLSIHSVSLYAFGARNKRNFVPKIMKDPKFTREGMFNQRKKDNYQYDLTQPHIQFPERYYDEKVDSKLERKAYLERRKERKGFEDITPEVARPLDSILRDLLNEEVLLRGSSRILKNIDEIETHHLLKIDEDVREIIIRSLEAINKRIHLKNLREVGIIAAFNRKYGIVDKEIWKNVKFALMKYFVREENDTIQLVDHERNEKNFVHTLNNVLQVGKKIDLDVSDLLSSVERNYAQKINSFGDIKNLIVFTTALSHIPAFKRTTLWETVDKAVAPKVNELSGLDAVTLINSFAKAQIIPTFADQLVQRFIADFQNVGDRKVEKLSIMAHALATLKKKDEKFNILVEREIEAHLHQVNNATDSRFILTSFSRLGLKSKKVYEHCAEKIIQNLESLSVDNLEHLLKTPLRKDQLPNNFFKAIAERTGQLLDETPYSFTKPKTEAILKGLERWAQHKAHVDEELLTKFRYHIQFLG